MVYKRAKFITIERPLIPPPPEDSEPYWCMINTLMFKKDGKTVWEQEIPEANLYWIPIYKYNIEKEEYQYWCDRFEKYFGCEVFKDEHFGWQLRLKIDHEYANIWHEKMMKWVQEYHRRRNGNEDESKNIGKCVARIYRDTKRRK